MGAVQVVLAQVELGLAVQRLKQVTKLTHGLGGTQKQQAARVQGVVEQRNQLLLQLGAHVDQHVAATDEVELGERRVLDHVVLGEHQHVANAFVNAVAAAVRLGGEKAGQARGRNVAGNAGRVQAGPRHRNGLVVDVGGENLHPEMGLELLHALLQQNRNGVGLDPGGAAGGPDAHHGAGRFAAEQLGDDLRLQRVKGLGVAEKVGHANQQVTKQGLHLGRVLLQVLDVAFHGVELLHRHAPLNAAVNGAGLVQRKIMAGVGAQQHAYFLQRVLGLGRGHKGQAVGGLQGARGQGHQLCWHAGRGQHQVGQLRGQGAARHAVKLGRLGALHQHQAARVLDGADAQRAIAARARQHHAHGLLLQALGQRGHEKVNRQAQPARGAGGQQLQGAVDQRHVAVGRHHINGVDLQRHAVLHFKHRQAGVLAHDFGQAALKVRRQVLHQHKGHARRRVLQAGKKSFKSGQPTGGGAQGHHRKSRWHKGQQLGGCR